MGWAGVTDSGVAGLGFWGKEGREMGTAKRARPGIPQGRMALEGQGPGKWILDGVCVLRGEFKGDASGISTQVRG